MANISLKEFVDLMGSTLNKTSSGKYEFRILKDNKIIRIGINEETPISVTWIKDGICLL